MLLVIIVASALILLIVVLVICCICKKVKDDKEDDEESNQVQETNPTPQIEALEQDRRQTTRLDSQKANKPSRPSVSSYDPTNIDDDGLIFESQIKGMKKQA